MSTKLTSIPEVCPPKMASGTSNVEVLYEQHHHWLIGWLCRRLGCPTHAADLAQDTFVRVLKREQEGELIRKPRAFLTTVAKGLLISHWRHAEIERAYLEALAARAPDVVISPEEHQLTLETLFQIDAMLQDLPERVRRAFLLSRLDGLTYKQIAIRLEVSERMVKKYMARAMLQCLKYKE